MAERDPYLLASVLEDVHVAHVLQRREVAEAVLPDLDQVPDLPQRLSAEGGVVVRRVADDFTTPLLAAEGWEAVFEDGNVVVPLGDLGFRPAGPRRAEWAFVGGGMVGRILSP